MRIRTKRHRIVLLIIVLLSICLFAEEEMFPLQVKSNPSGASVYLDSVLIGKTSLGTFLPEGKYKIRISKEGYLDRFKEFMVNERSYNNFTFNLWEKKCFIIFHNSVAKKQNEILINGVDQPDIRSSHVDPKKFGIRVPPLTTLYGIEVNPGNYEIVISRQGYYTLKRSIELKWGQSFYFDNPLIKITGRLQVAISPLETKCKLFKDGYAEEEWIGMIDLDDLQVGEYRLRCKCPGYLPENITVNIEENEISRLNIQLKEGPDVIVDLEEKRKILNYTEYKSYRDSIYRETILLITEKAKVGNAEAQYHLGYCYDKGIGVEQNEANAFKYYKESAQQGNPFAQNNLGLIYKNNESFEKAIELFRKATEKGNTSAQTNLANCYINGEGVKKDFKKAVEWYKKAADQGNLDAQTYLAVCYVNGVGVRKNLKKAVGWYRKAAEQGGAYAQYALGKCYENGQGVKKDRKQAIEWYKNAAGQGNIKAKEAIKELNIK